MDIADLCLPDCLIGLMRNNAWLIVRSKRYSCKYIDRRTGLQEIRNHFGKDLVSFFNTDLTEYAPRGQRQRRGTGMELLLRGEGLSDDYH